MFMAWPVCPLLLSAALADAAVAASSLASHPGWLPLSSTCRRRAFSGAQLVLQAAAGWRCASDLPFCFLLQTMLFVAFNKVGRPGWLALMLLVGRDG